jgi:hypothetical protein
VAVEAVEADRMMHTAAVAAVEAAVVLKNIS